MNQKNGPGDGQRVSEVTRSTPLRKMQRSSASTPEMATSQITLGQLQNLRTSCAVAAITDEDLELLNIADDDDDLEDAIPMDMVDHDATMQLDASMLSQGFEALSQSMPRSTSVAVRQDALVASELASMSVGNTSEIDVSDINVMIHQSKVAAVHNDTTRPNFGEPEEEKDGTVRQDMGALLTQLREMASKTGDEALDSASRARIENLIAELSSVSEVSEDPPTQEMSLGYESGFPEPGAPIDAEDATMSMSGLPDFGALGTPSEWPTTEAPNLSQSSTVSFSGLSDSDLAAAGLSPDVLEKAGFAGRALPPEVEGEGDEMLRSMLNSAIENVTFDEDVSGRSADSEMAGTEESDMDEVRRLVPTVAEAFPPQAVRELAAKLVPDLPGEVPNMAALLSDSPQFDPATPKTEAFSPVPIAKPEPAPVLASEPESEPKAASGPQVVPAAPMKPAAPPEKSHALLYGAIVLVALLFVAVAGVGAWLFFIKG